MQNSDGLKEDPGEITVIMLYYYRTKSFLHVYITVNIMIENGHF